MRDSYPKSLNCWLQGYGRAIKVTWGSKVSLLGGPWREHDKIDLFATPLSEEWQSPIPETSGPLGILAAIYTDTGEDDHYKIKMIIEGYGTFFYTDAPNLFLRVSKYFRVLSRYNGKTITFSRQDTIYTEIPKGEIPGIYIPPTPPPEPPGPGPGPGPRPGPYDPPDKIQHGIFIDSLLVKYGTKMIPPIYYNPNYHSTLSKENVGWTQSETDWEWLKGFLTPPYTKNGLSLISVQPYYEWRVWIFLRTGSVSFVSLWAYPEADISLDPEYTIEYQFNWYNITYRNDDLTFILWRYFHG
jgi:hypothetical protein